MDEPCDFLSAGNDNLNNTLYVILNYKKGKVQNSIIKKIGKLLAIPKSRANVKNPIDEEYSNSTLIHWLVNNAQKPFKKVILTARQNEIYSPKDMI